MSIAPTTTLHRRQEFLAFTEHVARTYPGPKLHLVMENFATHNRVVVRDWLDASPRIHVHSALTSGSWLNLDPRNSRPAAVADVPEGRSAGIRETPNEVLVEA